MFLFLVDLFYRGIPPTFKLNGPENEIRAFFFTSFNHSLPSFPVNNSSMALVPKNKDSFLCPSQQTSAKSQELRPISFFSLTLTFPQLSP